MEGKKYCPVAGDQSFSEQEDEVTGLLASRFNKNRGNETSSISIEN
jgi:hypothetical protein